MAGEEHGVVGHLGQLVGEAVVERGGSPPGRSVRPQPSRKRVSPLTRRSCDVEALAAGRVPRRVDQLDRDLADHHRVAAGVLHEVGLGEVRHPQHPRRLVGLHVDGHRRRREQLVHPRDGEAAHRPAHVVGVVVRGQRAGAAHAVLGQHVEDSRDVVGGVDDHRLARLAVADQVDEVDHLAGHRVGPGEVPPGEQLAEVEAVVGHGQRTRTARQGALPPLRVTPRPAVAGGPAGGSWSGPRG